MRDGCECPPDAIHHSNHRKEQCEPCARWLAPDLVHWNGAFYQCEECALIEYAEDVAMGEAYQNAKPPPF